MRKELVAQAVELTRQCLKHYWQGDAEFAISRCAEDVVWIASAQSQFLEGIQQVREDCRTAMPQLQRCHLLGQEFGQPREFCVNRNPFCQETASETVFCGANYGALTALAHPTSGRRYAVCARSVNTAYLCPEILRAGSDQALWRS